MKRFSMKSKWFPLCLLMALFSCGDEPEQTTSRVATLPFYQEATFTPQWIATDDRALDTFHRISPFTLVDQEGDTITRQTFAGKIYVADFFFTACPGICPKMTDNMSELQDEFLNDEDVLLLSHSVTPKYDSVAVLKSYAERKGVVSDKWHLVTGDQQEIYRLGRNDYFVEENLGLEKAEDDFLHTENFVLVDKHSHIRGIYNGLNTAAIRQLIADVRTLQQEI